MKLYHGSNLEIVQIELSKCRPYKDFGRGFYLTTIQEQAEKMAVRISRIYGSSPVITEYEFDYSALSDSNLNVKSFSRPSTEWARFVINNRNRKFSDTNNVLCNHDDKYDIVTGPVANDDLVLLFRQFSGGLIGVEALVKGMEYKILTDQYSFHSDLATSFLRKSGAYYV